MTETSPELGHIGHFHPLYPFRARAQARTTYGIATNAANRPMCPRSRLMENISKKKRGRPLSVFHDEENRRQVASIFREGKGARTLVNRVYFTRAMQALGFGKEAEFFYLGNTETDRFRMVILTELGRINDPELIRNLARDICRVKMKTAEAVAALRKRRAAAKPVTADDLVHALAMNLDRWLVREGATLTSALQAVERLQGILAGMIEKDGAA